MKSKIEIPIGIENGNILIYNDFIEEYFNGDVEKCLDSFRYFLDIIKYNQKITIDYDLKFKHVNIKVVMK